MFNAFHDLFLPFSGVPIRPQRFNNLTKPYRKPFNRLQHVLKRKNLVFASTFQILQVFVEFGLRFETQDEAEDDQPTPPDDGPGGGESESQPETERQDAEVVSLDRFRK